MEALGDEAYALLMPSSSSSSSSSKLSASDFFSCSELAAHLSSSAGAEGCSRSLRAALLDGGGESGGMQMWDGGMEGWKKRADSESHKN